MKEIKSSSDKSIHLRKLFVPSAIELAIYILLGVVLLSLFNLKVLWESLSNAAAVPVETANSVVSNQGRLAGQFIDGMFDGRLTTFVFWGFVGCLVYVVIWLIQNVLLNIKNDVVAGDYVQPKSSEKRGYWSTVIAEKLFLAGLVVIFILFVSLGLKFLAPVFSKLFYVAVYNFRFPVSVFEILTAVALMALVVYLTVLVARLAISTWRNIISNF